MLNFSAVLDPSDVDGAVGVTLKRLVEVTCCWSRVDKTGSQVGPACLVG